MRDTASLTASRTTTTFVKASHTCCLLVCVTHDRAVDRAVGREAGAATAMPARLFVTQERCHTMRDAFQACK